MARLLTPYWIIINWDRRSIWKQPYVTLEQAKKELNDQLARSNYISNGWVIEQREMFVEVKDSTGLLDEFSDF